MWLVLLAACGGAAPVRPVTHASVPRRAVSEPAIDDPLPEVKVRGLTGTLNHDDVHQTMDARQPELDRCIDEVRRQHRWVSGTIKFSFAVDAEGLVEDVHPTASDIGHQALERCLTEVVSQTQFPKPAGRATARFDWDMHVDGISSEPAEWLDPKSLRKALAKHARDVFRECKVRRRRQRFAVTAYVGRAGRVLSLGAVPSRPLDHEQLDCVLSAIKSWPLAKPKRRSKVAFTLR
jgi:hypothetical protein